MLASPALAGAHSFAASVSGNLRIPLPSVPAPSPTPARRAALSVVAKVKVSTPQDDRIARHVRLRKKVSGTTERPRLSVFRSNKHLYAQVIDDTKQCTLASASTMHKSLSKELEYSAGPTILFLADRLLFVCDRRLIFGFQEVAQKIGEVIAKSCLEKGITKVVFDRGGFLYHGRIKALADAAREHGLEF
ncbi:50S ribosomal protein L18, chloroplastic isoform X1 [Setaria italica]|uniref:Large ribosomal subunit protein uL18c n=1 Tax=Setaria italica TaxID=4555 RepID=K4AFJ7_SETIT|nr:50S ribosomal protein L18, chloroplastic isoform X1 [Setaria italica]XP_034574254.1 50S ribosomal protein L18, chloroplastic isoform X1 [Setaria viridis]